MLYNIISEDFFLGRDYVDKPVYEKSIVSFINVLLKHFKVETKYRFNEMEDIILPQIVGKEKIVVIILDSLGYKKFKELNVEFEKSIKLSSVFPTTTVAAVTSLLTAMSPQEHGLLGYIQFIREIGSIMNMIDFSYPGLPNSSFETIVKKKIKRLPNVFQSLKKEGYFGGILTSHDIVNSGLSFLIQKDANIFSYYSTIDMFANLQKLLESDFKGLLYVYYGVLDGIGHKKGPDSISYEREAKFLLEEIKKLKYDKKTQIFVVADHGMITTPREKNVFLGEELLKYLKFPPTGEMRMMYFYTKEKKDKKLIDYLNDKYSKRFEIYPSKQLLREGYFGFGNKNLEVEHRIGDYVLLAKDNYSFTYTYTGGEQKLLGMHGSLTYEELYVPLIFV